MSGRLQQRPASPRFPTLRARGAKQAQLHVLYVEDDDENREVTVAILGELGLVTTTATTAEEGIRAVEERVFDVVLVDLNLPDREGWHVSMAAKHRNPATPVVVLSGWGVNLSREEAARRGVDRILSKPVSPAELFSCVLSLATREEGQT
ncbi:MAG: response regulator [Deltaproteobacteria bacterium]|nr:response regulator [Deltaproteobacteria bacterium]